jgi:hypothetical protein
MTLVPASYLQDQFTAYIIDEISDRIIMSFWDAPDPGDGTWTNSTAPDSNWVVTPPQIPFGLIETPNGT